MNCCCSVVRVTVTAEINVNLAMPAGAVIRAERGSVTRSRFARQNVFTLSGRGLECSDMLRLTEPRSETSRRKTSSPGGARPSPDAAADGLRKAPETCQTFARMFLKFSSGLPFGQCCARGRVRSAASRSQTFAMRLMVAVPAAQCFVARVFKKKFQCRRFGMAITKKNVSAALMSCHRVSVF